METVSYTITSSMGEIHKADIPVSEALEDICTISEEKNKWVFIDGNQKSIKTLTTKDLTKGTIIFLTDQLMGG